MDEESITYKGIGIKLYEAELPNGSWLAGFALIRNTDAESAEYTVDREFPSSDAARRESLECAKGIIDVPCFDPFAD
jgi:hypothetical protein